MKNEKHTRNYLVMISVCANDDTVIKKLCTNTRSAPAENVLQNFYLHIIYSFNTNSGVTT